MPPNLYGPRNNFTMKELMFMIQEIVGYEGDFTWNTAMPDGMPQKLMDSSRIQKLGWKPKYGFRQGLQETYAWYKQHQHLYNNAHGARLSDRATQVASGTSSLVRS